MEAIGRAKCRSFPGFLPTIPDWPEIDRSHHSKPQKCVGAKSNFRRSRFSALRPTRLIDFGANFRGLVLVLVSQPVPHTGRP